MVPNLFQSDSIKNRYKLPLHPFFAGLIYFFGGSENPYDLAVKKIENENIEEALTNDLLRLKEDFYKVMESNSKFLHYDDRKDLIDAD
jgi:hypothetical protein